MALWDQFKWSVRHSKRQLLESILVVLAIALGVGVIITVLSMVLSVGQQYRANEQAEHFRTLEVMGKMEAIRREGAPLTLIGSDVDSVNWSTSLEELDELQAHLPATMHAYVETHWSATTPLLPEEDSDESASPWFFGANQLFIMGTTPEYFEFNGSKLQRGNFFLADDVKNKNPVIVLPLGIATELFGDDDPVGQVIPMAIFDEETMDYTVIGVLEQPEEERRGFRGSSRMVYAPITLAPYATPGEEGQMRFSNVSIGLDVGVDIPKALEIATSGAQLIWGDQVALASSLVQFQESQRQMQRYALLIGVLASIGLVIAVINILNLMLARVLKRTKSVGLSIALGSSRQMVFRQFMIEAMTLGVIGSLFGIILSLGLEKILKQALGAFFSPGLWGTRVLLGVVLGLVVSLFFGVYPAYLGSRTNPVDALRTD
ncbi:MAG: FtsX-like permease family protein [Firmicutes bacterium]|nr:FtsX-like permease family protein [Bacillota bacterium]